MKKDYFNLPVFLQAELKSFLSDKEFQIIELRYGLKNGTPHTQKEIGVIVKSCRGHICQIESGIYKKLRNNKPFQKIFDEYIRCTEANVSDKEKLKINNSEIHEPRLITEVKKCLLKDYVELLSQYKRLAVEIGRRPDSGDIRKYNKKGKIASLYTFKVYFGSLFEVQRRTGFIKNESMAIIKNRSIVQFKISFNKPSQLPEFESIKKSLEKTGLTCVV